MYRHKNVICLLDSCQHLQDQYIPVLIIISIIISQKLHYRQAGSRRH